MQTSQKIVTGVVGIAALALVGTGVANATSAGLIELPTPSSTTTTAGPAGPMGRPGGGHLKTVLDQLVKDGTLTQTQSDKITEKLAAQRAAAPDGTRRMGPGKGMGKGMGHGMKGMRGGLHDDVAAVLGVTADQLRTDIHAGKSLVQIAAAKGMDQATLIDKLTAAAVKKFPDADQTALRERITAMVTRTMPH